MEKHYHIGVVRCFIICLFLKKVLDNTLFFGFKNHFSVYTKNGWKTDSVYCLFQTLNLVKSYTPSVFLQHFFQKGEECERISLIPKLTYHTSIPSHSSFLHTSFIPYRLNPSSRYKSYKKEHLNNEVTPKS